MKKTYLVMAGFLVLSAGAPVFAADGFYAGAEGGATFVNDADFTGTGSSAGAFFTTEYDTGYIVGGFFGYQYQSMRVEAELAYRRSDWKDITDVTVAGVGTVASFKDAGIAVDGETYVLSGMINGYLDMHNTSALTPYIMAGVGAANVGIDNVSFTSGGVTVSADNEDDTVLAWQVGAGVNFAFNEMISLSVDYRYFATSDPEFSDVDLEYNSHNIMASLLFHF